MAVAAFVITAAGFAGTLTILVYRIGTWHGHTDTVLDNLEHRVAILEESIAGHCGQPQCPFLAAHPSGRPPASP